MSDRPALTDADERLLALLREHSIDAEVAVRLGVSVGDVKERIARLQAKVGVASRAELATWKPGAVATPGIPDEEPYVIDYTPGGMTGGGEVIDYTLPEDLPPDRRLSRRDLLKYAAAGVAGIGGMAGMGYLAMRGGRELTAVAPSSTPTPTATSTPSPTPTPTTPPAAASTATPPGVRGLPQLRIGGVVMQERHYGPGERLPSDLSAMQFMDAERGAITSYTPLTKTHDDFALDFRTTRASTLVTGALGASRTGFSFVRGAGTALSWSLDELELVGVSDTMLLFEERVPGERALSGMLHFVSPGGQHLGTVTADRGLLARDGRYVDAGPQGFLALGIDEHGAPSRVHLMQQKPPSTDTVFEFSDLPGDVFSAHWNGQTSAPELIVNMRRNQPGYDLVRFEADGMGGVTWTMAEHDGSVATPDGAVVARDVPLGEPWDPELGGGLGDPGHFTLDAMEIVAMPSGEPICRIRSAVTNGFGGHNRWTVDGRMLPIRVLSRDRSLPVWERETYALVDRTGALEPLLENVAAARGVIGALHGPTPSPIDSNLIAFGSTMVFHRNARRLVRANVDNLGVTYGYDLWRDRGTELRFSVPRPGRGLGPGPLRFPPKVEYPPYSSELRLRIAADGECLDLHAEPDPASEASQCLPDGAEVTLFHTSQGEYGRTDFEARRTWASVRLDSGETGWLDAGFLEWA